MHAPPHARATPRHGPDTLPPPATPLAQTPLALLQRARQPGGLDDLLQRVLPKWQPWQPPRGVGQALQQGGVLVFDGESLAFSHYDRATGAHADIGGVVALVQGLVTASEAGAAACAAGGGSGAGASAQPAA